MKTEKMTLAIDICGFWHSGTGRGSGSHLDALVDTAHDGLPYLSGRHIKGLLRDAVYKAEQWGQLDTFKTGLADTELTDILFGRRYQNPETSVPRDETTQGYLRIGDGLLPGDLRRWLAQQDQEKYRSYLYRDLSSTAIDASTGVAISRSLRGIQVTVPMCLESELTLLAPLKPVGRLDHNDAVDALIGDRWQKILTHCLPLIRSVGAHRTRGLGRARLQLQKGASA